MLKFLPLSVGKVYFFSRQSEHVKFISVFQRTEQFCVVRMTKIQ